MFGRLREWPRPRGQGVPWGSVSGLFFQSQAPAAPLGLAMEAGWGCFYLCLSFQPRNTDPHTRCHWDHVYFKEETALGAQLIDVGARTPAEWRVPSPAEG